MALPYLSYDMHHNTCALYIYKQPYLQFLLRVCICIFPLSGCKEVPEPVCALVKFWSGDPIGSAAYAPKVGVDHNNLHWKSLKPFDSSDVYLAGDTFCPITESRGLSRWSESALLTSERILHKYFHLDPFTENLTLTNQWPDGCKM